MTPDTFVSTVTIVGDDDQAIFEWRGATPKYIVSPGKYFNRKFATFGLEINYRSPKNIVELSQRIIENNTERVRKKLMSRVSKDAYVEVVKSGDLTDAMSRVISEYERTAENKAGGGRIAVIGRKKSQLIPYQLYFASNDIPFCAAEDLQIFMSAAFERLMRLLLIKCGAGEPLVSTQINDGIETLCDLVKRYPLNKPDRTNLHSYFIREKPKTVKDGISKLADYRGPLKGKNEDGEMSLQFATCISAFINAESVSSSLNALAENFAGLQADLGKAEDDVFYVDPPFLHLAEYATRYRDNYAAFIEDIERAKDQLALLPLQEDSTETNSTDDCWKRPVHLMTAPRAKGKEFDTVVLLDVNEGMWPNKNAQTPEELEAERRVFYVAFTRVKKRLILMVNETYHGNPIEPSRFLREAGLN